MKLRSEFTLSTLLLLRICTKVSYAGPVLNRTKVKNELMYLLWFGWRHLVVTTYLSGPTGCSLDNWDFSACLQCRFWQISDDHDDWRQKSLICLPAVKCASLPWKSACICFSKNVCFHGGSAREWLVCDERRGRVQCDSFQRRLALFLVVAFDAGISKACLDDVSALEQWRRLAWCGGTVEFGGFKTSARKLLWFRRIGWKGWFFLMYVNNLIF